VCVCVCVCVCVVFSFVCVCECVCVSYKKGLQLTKSINSQRESVNDGRRVAYPEEMRRLVPRKQRGEFGEHLQHVASILTETASNSHPVKRKCTEIPNAKLPLFRVSATVDHAVHRLVLKVRKMVLKASKLPAVRSFERLVCHVDINIVRNNLNAGQGRPCRAEKDA
jgi:hypothetical protein